MRNNKSLYSCNSTYKNSPGCNSLISRTAKFASDCLQHRFLFIFSHFFSKQRARFFSRAQIISKKRTILPTDSKQICTSGSCLWRGLPPLLCFRPLRVPAESASHANFSLFAVLSCRAAKWVENMYVHARSQMSCVSCAPNWAPARFSISRHSSKLETNFWRCAAPPRGS